MATEARCGAAFTLNEVIRTIRPIHSLHAYFTCDADFLFECYAERELRRQPMTVILGERWGTDADEFRAACSSAFPAHNVTGARLMLLCLCDVFFSVVSAPLPLTWGSHHSKLSMFEDEAGAVHILIGTANLTRGSIWKTITRSHTHTHTHTRTHFHIHNSCFRRLVRSQGALLLRCGRS